MNIFGQDPVPAYIKNLHNGELKGFLVNPAELGSSISAVYKPRDLLGMPNVPLDYEKTNNQTFRFNLIFSATMIQTEGRVSRKEAVEAISDWRAFLTSLMAPIETPHKNWRGGEPPKIWFYWPNIASLEGRLVRVNWRSTLFDLDLNSTFEVAQISISSDQKYPIWSEEIRLLGWEVQV